MDWKKLLTTLAMWDAILELIATLVILLIIAVAALR